MSLPIETAITITGVFDDWATASKAINALQDAAATAGFQHSDIQLSGDVVGEISQTVAPTTAVIQPDGPSAQNAVVEREKKPAPTEQVETKSPALPDPTADTVVFDKLTVKDLKAKNREFIKKGGNMEEVKARMQKEGFESLNDVPSDQVHRLIGIVETMIAALSSDEEKAE